MDFILQWIDLFWLVFSFIFVHAKQRKIVAGFFIACMIMMRLQVELMGSIGYPNGLVGIMNMGVMTRGLITYSMVYMIYILLAYYSKESRGPVFLGASLAIFFLAFFISSVVMVL